MPCEVRLHSRRKFIQALSASSLLMVATDTVKSEEMASRGERLSGYTIPLSHDWEFRFDPSAAQEASDVFRQETGWSPVQVPHTWQSLGRSPEYAGVAWYRLRLEAPINWASRHVRIEFEAVNHTAHVFLNGQALGEHVGKGYTAFTLDLSPHLKLAGENTLLVRVDNRPNDRMLPRNKNYDWTDDGGIIRPVNLLVTPQAFIERVEIDALPDSTNRSAEFRIRALVRNTMPQRLTTTLNATICRIGAAKEELRLTAASVPLGPHSSEFLELGPATLHNPALWHFDSPHLYRARIELNGPADGHEFIDQFGIRRFEVRGSAFYLNGEKVSLMGVERMAGSHPELGLAESSEWIESNHRDMKELNCVFTRVHWPQDRRVLDFCDRHGILMQEEVPAWGPETFRNTSDDVQRTLEQNGLEQLGEMIQRDRNHPCIVAWGLCNEVDGKNPRTQQFARVVGGEARRLDPSRLQTYASNTLGSDPGSDMAGEFDFISTNEYYGSWTPGAPADVEAHLDRIRKAFPDKPIVVSEYGWCECQPMIMPGDENRVSIVNSHTEVFRGFPEVAGAIYFDYNDYRTLVGDKGAGAMRQRVHGVVDLYGRKKPSFEALRLQASPVENAILSKAEEGRYKFEVTTRQRLPSYTLRGYSLRWLAYGYDDLPMDGGTMDVAELHPESSRTYEIRPSIPAVRRIVVDLLRPTGFSAVTVEYLDKASRS
jgi:beta-galactosidase